jgi:hypothetical protein
MICFYPYTDEGGNPSRWLIWGDILWRCKVFQQQKGKFGTSWEFQRYMYWIFEFTQGQQLHLRIGKRSCDSSPIFRCKWRPNEGNYPCTTEPIASHPFASISSPFNFLVDSDMRKNCAGVFHAAKTVGAKLVDLSPAPALVRLPQK